MLGQGADSANAAPGATPFPAMQHAFGAAGVPLPEFGGEWK